MVVEEDVEVEVVDLAVDVAMTVAAIMETAVVVAVDVVETEEAAITNHKEREIGGVPAVTTQISHGEISAIGKGVHHLV